MSKGYLVRKKIRGRTYLYRQRSWREAGKVRTECVCLGPVTDVSKSSGLIEKHEFGNPFETSNTTNKSSEFGNPFAEPDSRRQSHISGHEYLKELQVQADEEYQAKMKAGNIKPVKRSRANRNTTSQEPRNVCFSGSLDGYKVSEVALQREFSALVKNLEALGLDTMQIPRVRIAKGNKAGWRKSWFGGRVYVVTLPEKGGRTKFKQAYREALASCLLEELRRQDKAKYKALMRSAPRTSFRKGKQVRDALVTIMQHGEKEAEKRFAKLSRFRKQKDKKLKGVTGKATLKALQGMDLKWG